MTGSAYDTGTGLDALLGGGIQSGKALILAGPPGAGKSLIALRFISQGLGKDDPGVYISFTRTPLSSTLQEAKRYGVFAGLLSSDRPIFFTSGDPTSATGVVNGARRVVLDHPESLVNDPGWIEPIAELLAHCRASGAGVMVLTYGERSPLLFLCDGIAAVSRTEGRQRVELMKWPFGRTGVEAEGEAGEWMR